MKKRNAKPFTYPGGTLGLPLYFRSEVLARFMSEAEMTALEENYQKHSYRSTGRVRPDEEEMEIALHAVEHGPMGASQEFKIKKEKIYTILSKVALWNFYNPDDQVALVKKKTNGKK